MFLCCLKANGNPDLQVMVGVADGKGRAQVILRDIFCIFQPRTPWYESFNTYGPAGAGFSFDLNVAVAPGFEGGESLGVPPGFQMSPPSLLDLLGIDRSK